MHFGNPYTLKTALFITQNEAIFYSRNIIFDKTNMLRYMYLHTVAEMTISEEACITLTSICSL